MAHPDLDLLLNLVLPFGQEQLEKRNGFQPFGATMKADGTPALSAGDLGEGSADSLIAFLTEAFRREASAGAVRAACLCVDARVILPGVSEKSDAICVGLEHQNGEAVDVFLPYKMNESGKVMYGELVAGMRNKEFFA